MFCQAILTIAAPEPCLASSRQVDLKITRFDMAAVVGYLNIHAVYQGLFPPNATKPISPIPSNIKST